MARVLQSTAVETLNRSAKHQSFVLSEQSFGRATTNQQWFSHRESANWSDTESKAKEKQRQVSIQLPYGAYVEESFFTESPFSHPMQADEYTLANHVDQEDDSTNWWQEYGIPSELGLVQLEIPQELRSLLEESLNHFKAIQASLRDQRTKSIFPTEAYSTLLSNNAVSSSSSLSVPSLLPSAHKASTQQRVASVTSISTVNDAYSSSSTSIGKKSNQSATTRGSKHDSISSNLQPDFISMDKATPLKDSKTTQKKHPFLRLFRGRNTKNKALQPVPLPPATLKPITLEPFALQPDNDAASQSYRECAGCFDDIPKENAISLSCQHYYCSQCFSRLVITAMISEHTFPPKCCLQRVPEKTLKNNLSSDELSQYHAKVEEYSVPAENRWFCASLRCGKWFEQSHNRMGHDTVTCPHCKTQMCSECRGLQHVAGGGCPRDQALHATLEEAERNGWRRCLNCHALVELIQGCRHMKCRCGAHFCYACGARYGTCGCTERDHAARQVELSERRRVREAKEAAENVEVRAAIAAVEEVERKEGERQAREEEHTREASMQAELRRIEVMEARTAEEVQIIERIEAARHRDISQHYESLQAMMAKLHGLQEAAVSQRRQQVEGSLIQEYENIQSKEKDVKEQYHFEAAIFKQDLSRISRDIHEKYARKIMNANARYKAEVDNQHNVFSNTFAHEAEKGLAQEANEIRILRLKLDQELLELKSLAIQPHLSDNLLHKQQLVKQRMKEYQAIRYERERTLRAEALWLYAVIEERKTMLIEDQQRLERSGGEIGGGDVHNIATTSFDKGS